MYMLYRKWDMLFNMLFNTGNTAQCYVATWIGEELGRNGHCLLEVLTFIFHVKGLLTKDTTCFTQTIKINRLLYTNKQFHYLMKNYPIYFQYVITRQKDK